MASGLIPRLREYAPSATEAMALEEAGGQIYFVLLAEMQRRRLTRDEVAKLAVKASSALVKDAAKAAAAQPSSPCPRRSAVAPLVFPVPEEEYAAADPVWPVSAQVASPQKRRVACRDGRAATRFSPDLTAIPESE